MRLPRGIFFILFLVAVLVSGAGAQEAPDLSSICDSAVLPDGITPEKCRELKERAVQGGVVKENAVAPPQPSESKKDAPAQKEKPSPQSLFDRYSSPANPQDISTALKPYGYEVFTSKGLAASGDLPVPSDYMIGPGDEVSIMLWGRVNGQYTLKVSREGTITFPSIGPLKVAGMSFEEMKKFLSHQARSIVGTDISTTMGRLRSIQVFVLGEAREPGAYLVSGMSTVTSALILSGGPSDIGSLRGVEVKRNSKTIETVDFYDLLLKGDRSRDLRLQNGDVIFIPTIGPLAGISGNVKRPAVYEMKEGTFLKDALSLAGGIIPSAYTQQVQVERIERGEKRIVVDVNAGDRAGESFKLQDGDLVKVFSIADRDVNAVYLEGNVKRPGKYELKPGMRICDILKDEGDLKPETYLSYALIKRTARPGGEMTVRPFDLGRLLGGAAEENVELSPRDTIQVFSRWDFEGRPKVTVEGEVRCASEAKGQSKGCSFELKRDMRVRDAILQAGGITADTSLEDFEIYSIDRLTKKTELRKLNLSRALAGDAAHNVPLREGDRVVLHTLLEKGAMHYVSISGEISRPGKYPLSSGMKIKDLLFSSGLLESAYLDESELATPEITEGESYSLSYKKISLRKAKEGDPEHNLRLKPYDSLFVKKIPYWLEAGYVDLNGEVAFPGRYTIKKGERLSSVIERAGGFTDKAYLKGVIFKRESVRALQQKNLDRSIAKLEKEFLSQSVGEAQKTLNADDAKTAQVELENKKALIQKLKEAKAEGRVSVHISEGEDFRGGPQDLELENGDVLLVPDRPAQVQVLGAVYNQTAFVHTPKGTVRSYLKMAGGFTRDADESEIYILKVDGTAVSKKERGALSLDWDGDENRWVGGGFMSMRVDPGDTIVVPEKIEKVAWLKEAKDITQILYQIAVTAGVLIVAF